MFFRLTELELVRVRDWYDQLVEMGRVDSTDGHVAARISQLLEQLTAHEEVIEWKSNGTSSSGGGESPTGRSS